MNPTPSPPWSPSVAREDARRRLRELLERGVGTKLQIRLLRAVILARGTFAQSLDSPERYEGILRRTGLLNPPPRKVSP